MQDGVVIHVEKGRALDLPVQLLFCNNADRGAFATFPRVLIVVDEGGQLKVNEFHSGTTGTYLSCPVAEVVLHPQAHLELNKVQSESRSAFHIALTQGLQMDRSVFLQNGFNFGGSIARNDVNSVLNGRHIETWLNGISLGGGSQVIDNHTQLDHAMPDCQSFEIYKTVLDGKAIGVFNGKIFVYQDAQKTDAKQTNQALLLSADATMNTKPQLEIFADDVKCTHGATIGYLDHEALFYLRSRGIPKEEAEGLLTYAFVSEVIDKVSFKPLRDSLSNQLFERLAIARSA
jgi:Fe-S cluster assembly protein SufD